MDLINLVTTKLPQMAKGSISYTLPDHDGNFVHACRKTFINVFDVTRKPLVGLINMKKIVDTTFTDRRSNNKLSKFTEKDHQLIYQHINSIPRDLSHYSRAKSEKQYISPDL